MPSLFRLGHIVGMTLALMCATLSAGEPGPAYVPEPEIADMVQRATDKDRAVSVKAIDQLSEKGGAAERALSYYLFKEATPSARAKYAELLARCNLGRVGYRIIVELQPDGSGTLTLWSDRALLAECGKRYARIMNEPEPVYDEVALRQNPFGKGELLRNMGENVKFLEGRVENVGDRIEAMGALSFKNFDAFSSFADGFDASGYYLISGMTLTDKQNVRTLHYRKQREPDAEQFQRNLLLFHNVRWEFVLDFKGKIGSSNAMRTDGSRMLWSFNCYQMLKGEALVEATFTNEGLLPRPALDESVAIPAVVAAGQPVAIPRQREIHAKVFNRPAGSPKPSAKELREKGQLVELDARGSLPKNQALQCQWLQTYGADLNLTSDALSKDYVCLIIKEPGEYRFELTVSANGNYSKPAEVKVFVDGDTVAAVPPKNEEPKPTPPQKPPEPKVVQENTPAPPKKDPKPEPKLEPKVTATEPPPPAKPEAKADPAKAKQLYESGLKLFKAGDYASAKRDLQGALDAGLDDIECKFDLGMTLMELQEYQAAIIKFEEVGDSKSKRTANALMNIGHCYVRTGNLDDARNYYRRGAAVGKDAVMWETLWQLGSKQVAAQDYESALNSYLKEAEARAAAAKVQDYRLLRDMAIALHGVGQSAEALKRLEAMQALGYTPDPKLLAEVKQKAGPVHKTDVAVKTEPEKAPEPAKPPEKKEDPKPEPARTVAEVKPQPAKTDPAVNPDPPKPEKRPIEAKTAEKKPGPALPEPRTLPEPRLEVKKKPERKPIPKKPLPPVPSDFNDALAAGKKALEAGEASLKENTDDSRVRAYQSFDEAEAMLRGAWNQKPGDAGVVASMEQLTKHVGPIALAKNTYIKARVRGLVVLDAEPSIATKDKDGNAKPLYYVWEQIEGDGLEQRPEDMAMRKVGLRIPRPGVYKFDLAVSDGARSGNPVTVTVEVVE